MRTILFFLCSALLYHSSAYSATFIFKSGKSVEGSIRFEDAKSIRILEKSGLEMTLRKSELNLEATRAANLQSHQATEAIAVQKNATPVETKSAGPKKVFTNRDVKRTRTSTFVPPNPETHETWGKAIAKLERDFVKLQGACRGAGTGPNLSKIKRTETYKVNGKPVKVTGYWADPANIDEAKRICERAIETEQALNTARSGFQNFLESESFTEVSKGGKGH